MSARTRNVIIVVPSNMTLAEALCQCPQFALYWSRSMSWDMNITRDREGNVESRWVLRPQMRWDLIGRWLLAEKLAEKREEAA